MTATAASNDSEVPNLSNNEAYGDLLALPYDINGPRAPVYQGMVWLVVIEAIVMVWLLLSYFYLRVEAIPVWPPPGIPLPDIGLSGVASGGLLLSTLPIALLLRDIRRGRQRGLWLWLPLAWLLAAGYLGLSIFDALDRDYAWDTHAYGSVVWTITGYQMLHALILLSFGTAVMLFGWMGNFDGRHHLGVETLGLYWYFVAVAGVPVYVTVYLAPYLLR